MADPQPPRLNGPMVARLRRCAADTSSNWDGKITVYPPEARQLVDLIDAAGHEPERLRAAGWHVFEPGTLYLRRVEHEGVRMRVIPRALHDVLCDWRVATPQGTTPEVLGCAGCGFCYPGDEETDHG